MRLPQLGGLPWLEAVTIAPLFLCWGFGLCAHFSFCPSTVCWESDGKKEGDKASGGIWPFSQNPGQMAMIKMHMGLTLGRLQSMFN